jgi:hypothetical protein
LRFPRGASECPLGSVGELYTRLAQIITRTEPYPPCGLGRDYRKINSIYIKEFYFFNHGASAIFISIIYEKIIQ